MHNLQKKKKATTQQNHFPLVMHPPPLPLPPYKCRWQRNAFNVEKKKYGNNVIYAFWQPIRAIFDAGSLS